MGVGRTTWKLKVGKFESQFFIIVLALGDMGYYIIMVSNRYRTWRATSGCGVFTKYSATETENVFINFSIWVLLNNARVAAKKIHTPHFENGVTLTRKKLSLKCCQSPGQIIHHQKEFRSFKRGTVSLCRSKGFKVTVR